MRKLSRHALIAATAALALTGVAGGLPLAASAASGRAAASSLAPLWADRFVQGGDPGAAVATASAVFVTGSSALHPNGSSYATEAYSAATGARLWSARYQNSTDNSWATAIAANQAGTVVFVAGSAFTAVAYNAATGARLWVATYNGPGTSYHNASSITVSPDGSEVFVTGVAADNLLGPSFYVTAAYNAATGAQLWLRRDNAGAQADSIAVNPNGSAVYVTGYSTNGNVSDYLTIAYSPVTGAQLWLARYHGPADTNEASALAVSENGREVAVTGSSQQGPISGLDYATVAYNAATGAKLWVARYKGPADIGGGAVALAFSNGGKLFVTGASGRYNNSAYATIAYTAGNGRQLWASRYSTPGGQSSGATSVTVAAPGGQVYVAGTADGGRRGINTIAYDTTNGKTVWVSRYPSPGQSTAVARAIAVDQDNVFVIGHSGTGGGFITLAYPALRKT